MNAPQIMVIVLLSIQFFETIMCKVLKIKVEYNYGHVINPFVTAALLYWGGFW